MKKILREFFSNIVAESVDWQAAAVTMNLESVGAQVLNVEESPDGSYADVTVKVRVSREYAENLSTYTTPSPTKKSRRKGL